MSARASRGLPGFRFETQAPPLPEVLPRMDIAVFVGFAASGPLQTPVAVESEVQFAAIFGGDAPLAWDLERGEQVHAHLGPAIRAFFRNGGQRCWVIRVARQTSTTEQPLNRARYNYFPIPYLARAEFNANGQIGSITPAFARGRSEGSWSDAIRVSSALLSRPIQVDGSLTLNGSNYVVHIVRDPSNPLAIGEMLRLVYETAGVSVLLAVESITSEQPSPATAPVLNVTSRRAVWLLSLVKDIASPPPNTPVKAAVFTRESISSPLATDDSIAAFETVYDAVLSPDQTTLLIDDRITLKLVNCPLADAPQPGALVRIDQGTNHWWMTVDSLDVTSGADGVPLLSGSAVRVIDAPNPLPIATPSAERLSFELWVRQAEEYAISLSDIGFAPAHERFWASLPTDEEVYRPTDLVEPENPATFLWRQVGDLFRFPLAGLGVADEIFFPVLMPGLAENYLGPVTLPGSERERDGLAEFDVALFLDPDLTEIGAETLASTADFLQYLSPRPRRLNGIHAVFPLEEATIIAVPDAVHVGWVKQAREPIRKPEPSLPPLRPEWWHFLDCNSSPEKTPALSSCEPELPEPSPIKPVHEPEWGNFLNCSIQIIDPPQLFAFPERSSDGNVTLRWESSPPSEANAGNFILEESSQPNFSDAVQVYAGTSSSYTLYGRRTGDYYYRVRVVIGADTSDWSNGVAVRVEEDSRWIVDKQKYSADVLLAVQRALLRMCAARGDVLGVLSLPEHYREDNAIEHANLLRATSNVVPPTAGVSPLGFGELNVLSYGAVYHPWIVGRENQGDTVVTMPPCGAVSGSISEAAIRRGAWIAPANRPLRGVVALKPTLQPEKRLALQDAFINVVRQEPRGFVVLNSDTLSTDEDLREISVRRLLILLRRQALQLGVTYVFEPNSNAFRRAVDRGYTEMLDGMFERGAFAGPTPATSFQVVTDTSLNTPQSVDLGRFIIELRVAPSLPMRFLTIRLVQTSDRTQALELI
jgi:hypothetical protein